MSKPAVLIVAHSEYRGIYGGVARMLKGNGATPHLYVALTQQIDFYKGRDPDLYEDITLTNHLYRSAAEQPGDADAVLAQARINEEWLGVSYNSIMLTDRHFGRGYALGGFRHPRSTISQNSSYLQIVNAINKTIAFWRSELDRTGARLILNGGKIAALVARAQGVEYRTLAASRYKNYHYWAVNEFFENPAFEPAFEQTESGDGDGLENPYETHLQMRALFKSQISFTGVMKEMTMTAVRRFYWRLRGYDKAKGYYLSDELRYLWSRYRDLSSVTERSVGLNQLKGKRFIYYPLHTEPETALQTLSPEYFFQLSCIASLARDLPAGVVLAVKETIAALGRRPRDFYDQIAEFKNVVFIDPSELGLRAAAESDAVATITGTGGLEGAVLGKPVLSFGLHNYYNFVPHVRVMREAHDIRDAMEWALGDAFDGTRARQDGMRLLRAIENASFDLGSFTLRNPDEVPEAGILDAYNALVGGLPASAGLRPADETALA